MVLKEFQVDVPNRGTVNVEFHLHFDAHISSVGEIKIHSDFDSGIPHRVQLQQDGTVWKLYIEHPAMEGGKVMVTPQFLNDELSMLIARRILAIKNDESPA